MNTEQYRALKDAQTAARMQALDAESRKAAAELDRLVARLNDPVGAIPDFRDLLTWVHRWGQPVGHKRMLLLLDAVATDQSAAAVLERHLALLDVKYGRNGNGTREVG